MLKYHDPRIAPELKRLGTWLTPGFLSQVAAFEVYATGIDAGLRIAGHFNSASRQSIAALAAKNLIAAASPMNTLAGNPAAQREALRTHGKSLSQGARNFLDDAIHHGSYPLLADETSYKVGENLAITPGHVVRRERLFELIQYSPVTAQVHEVPVLLVPPPINKFTIMDLRPGKSYVEFLVASGFTVYMLSWVNPDLTMSGVSYEDYILGGVVAALDAIPAPKVNVVGLCLGGTFSANVAALKGKVNTAGFCVTLTDFGGNIGPMGAMMDQKAIDKIAAKNAKAGVLSGKKMEEAFKGLNIRDLILEPMIQQWLFGKKPPPSDLLTWNADKTNLPGWFHTQYLTWCYLKNLFAKGELEIGGQTIGISDIEVPTYWVAGEADHIVYWDRSFAGASLTSGPRRLVLSSRGHIGVIVDPPSERASHLVGPSTFTDAASWKAAAVKVKGTWWQDQVDWLKPFSGQLLLPPVPAEILCAAPGTYILAKV